MPRPHLMFACALWLLAGAAAPALAGSATVLYRFTGGGDGASPVGPLVADPAGRLYGATEAGGLGFGVIFELAPPATLGGAWTETVLHVFNNEADGAVPAGGLALDAAGNLYGATSSGGGVFRLAPPASPDGPWTFSLLYAFGSSATLANAPVLDAEGNLYGTSYYGGAFEFDPGLAYRLSPTPDGTVPWNFELLHAFTGYPSDGAYPAGTLTVDGTGTVYGTTSEGGPGACFDAGTFIGCGTVFALRSTSAGWVESEVHAFTVHEGDAPLAGVALAADGALYGTAGYDAFRLEPERGGRWRKRTLYRFTAGIGGTTPDGLLLLAGGTTLYGTSSSSGLSGYGTAFRLTPSKPPARWREATLASFGSGFDGPEPAGGLAFGLGHRLYGVTRATAGGDFGTVFSVAP